MKLLAVVECRWPPTRTKGQAGSQAPPWRTQQDANDEVAYLGAAFAGLQLLLSAHFSCEHNQNRPSILSLCLKAKATVVSMCTVFSTWVLKPSSRGLVVFMGEEGVEGARWLSEFLSSCVVFPSPAWLRPSSGT